MSTTVTEADLRPLRLALMSLGGPPQAQRHHTRVGTLQRACQTLEGLPERLPTLEAAGLLDAEQADELRRVREQLGDLTVGWRDRVPPEPEQAGFDFLWGPAFEDEEWDALRRTARAAFTTLRGSDNPWVG
jgi:hypothetical protein